MAPFSKTDGRFMRRALQLARKGLGMTSPNPAVGCVIVKRGCILGEGWHRKAGSPHAEVEAIRDALGKGGNTKGATLYVTLEPCSTQGRTPPCCNAILDAGISKVIVAAVDPNPKHAAAGLKLLESRGVTVRQGLLASASEELNEGFNHWILHQRPLVTLKSAMTLDGKIATRSGSSKWITSEASRKHAQKIRLKADAILVGVQTVITDDPSLTCRAPRSNRLIEKPWRRIILDPRARTPLKASLLNDAQREQTLIVVGKEAPSARVQRLADKVQVLKAPTRKGSLDLHWLMTQLGRMGITHLLVEGGGQTLAGFLDSRIGDQVAFFYAPKILGGADSRPAVGGTGASKLDEAIRLKDTKWKKLGPDLMLSAKLDFFKNS